METMVNYQENHHPIAIDFPLGGASVRVDAVVEALQLLGAQRAAHVDEASKPKRFGWGRSWDLYKIEISIYLDVHTYTYTYI